jgi:hypothetical protein
MHSRKTGKARKPKSVTAKNGASESAAKNPFQTNAGYLERTAIPGTGEPVDLDRHAAKCRICSHAQRHNIEADFVDWRSPAQIAQDYGLADRSSIYRHAHALRLFGRRRRNMRAALELIIEQVGDVEVNASAVVAAVQVCAKINARGELIESDDRLELHDLFDRMKPEEYDAYAKDGTLPTWFHDEIAAAGGRALKGDDHV